MAPALQQKVVQKFVMPGLVPGIHAGPTGPTSKRCAERCPVDGRDEPGHDERRGLFFILIPPSMAEIDFDDLGVRLDLGHGAFREDLALVQDGDLVGDVLHELHVVLDDDD